MRRTVPPSAEIQASIDKLLASKMIDDPSRMLSELLESSQLERHPPSLVQHSQEVVRWLSRSIACVDEDSRETTEALADTLARLLVVSVFAEATTCSDAGGD